MSEPEPVPERSADGRHAEDDVEVPLDVLQEEVIQVGEGALAAHVSVVCARSRLQCRVVRKDTI